MTAVSITGYNLRRNFPNQIYPLDIGHNQRMYYTGPTTKYNTVQLILLKYLCSFYFRGGWAGLPHPKAGNC